MKIVHGNTLKCEACPEIRFSTISALEMHRTESHGLPILPNESNNKFKSGLATPEASQPQAPSSSSSTTPSSKDEFHDAEPPPQVYQHPRETPKETATETTTHRCDECKESFENEAEMQIHLANSPFHGTPALECYECKVAFPNQIELLKHIESRPHSTRWILSMV
jgi:hypothetical protein